MSECLHTSNHNDRTGQSHHENSLNPFRSAGHTNSMVLQLWEKKSADLSRIVLPEQHFEVG